MERDRTTDGSKSFWQRLASRLMPAKAADIERESKEWFATCGRCGLARSYWELGGVRYGARSSGKRIRIRCSSCGQASWHRVERRPHAADTDQP